MKKKQAHLLPVSLAAGITLVPLYLHAAPVTWDAGGANANWSTINNWSDNAAATGDDLTFNATGASASGVTSTVDASISIASLTYTQESATLQHTTNIAAGQTLAVTGNFLLAGSATATTATNVTISGSTGTVTVGGTSFQVGQTTPTAGTTTNSLDLSGLGTFTANLGSAGTFRLGANSITTFGSVSTVKLAATSSISTGTLGIGDKAGRSGSHILKLGGVSNTVNADILSVGSTNGRGSGELSFESGTGTLQLRAANGTSAVGTMNLVNNAIGHNGTHAAVVNFAGHFVDARIGALTMARRTGTGTLGSTATLTFDTGVLEVDTVNMAANGNVLMTGANNATINIGGGTASFNSITMATSSGGTGSTTTALINLTGGSTTVNNNISRGANTGTGNTSATVVISGGTLDMTAGNIGSLASAVTLTLESGTLQNVAQINGGGAVSKTTSGTLTLAGANTYTGATNVDGGKLVVNGNISTSTLTTVKDTATLAGTGTTGAVTVNLGGALAPGDGGIESLDITGSLTLENGSSSNFEINTAGNLSDLAIVSASLAFGGTLTVTRLGDALVDGDVFNLFDWTSASGTFATVNLPALTNGLVWDQSNLYTNGTLAVIPEPGISALFCGCGVLGLLRRRRSE